MTLTGRIRNGVVVLDAPPPLPEGAAVTVSLPDPPPRAGPRVQIPLVRTGEPGTLHLTNTRIAEIFEEEDVASSGR
jgi:hypothetical protein